IELVDPDARERVAAGLSSARGDGGVVELTCRLRGSEAKYRDAALRCGPDAASGALVVACSETSSLEEMRAQRDDARRRLAALFETMHDLVFTTDEDGVLNGVNRVPVGLTLADTLGAPM